MMEQGEICLARTLCILKRMAAGMLVGVVGLLMVAGGIIVGSVLLPCRDFTVDLENTSGKAISLARLDVGNCDVWEGSLAPGEKKKFRASAIRCGRGVHLMTCDPAGDTHYDQDFEPAGTYDVEVMEDGKLQSGFDPGGCSRQWQDVPLAGQSCMIVGIAMFLIDHLRCVWDFSHGVSHINPSYELSAGEGFFAGGRNYNDGAPYPQQAKWCEDEMRKQDEERVRKEEWRKSQIVLPLEYDEEKP